MLCYNLRMENRVQRRGNSAWIAVLAVTLCFRPNISGSERPDSESPAAGRQPDKSQYNLFHPTPPELLREFAEYRLLVYGAALVAMMILRPEGLWPETIRRREFHAGENEGEKSP